MSQMRLSFLREFLAGSDIELAAEAMPDRFKAGQVAVDGGIIGKWL